MCIRDRCVGWGVLQAFADVFKLLFKEVVQPTVAHPVVYLSLIHI